MRVAFCLWSSSPNHNPANHEEKTLDIPQNSQSALLKVVQVTKNQGSLRSCHSPEEPKELGCYKQSGASEGILGQKEDIR